VAATHLVAGTGTPSQIPACSLQFHIVFCFISETLERPRRNKSSGDRAEDPPPSVCFLTACLKLTGHHPGVTTCHRLPVSYPMPISACGYVSDPVVPILNYCPLTPLQALKYNKNPSVAVSISRRRCAGSRTPISWSSYPQGVPLPIHLMSHPHINLVRLLGNRLSLSAMSNFLPSAPRY